MSFNFLSQLKPFVSKAGTIVSDNAPLICGIGSFVTGAGALIVMYTRSIKCNEILEEAKKEKHEQTGNDKLSKTETIKIVTKTLWPAAALGTASALFLFGSLKFNYAKISALTAAGSLATASLKELKESTAEVVGESVVEEIKSNVATKKANKVTKSKDKEDTYDTKDGKLVPSKEEYVVVDEYFDRYFVGSNIMIQNAIADLDKKIAESGEATLNDFYDILRLKGCHGDGLKHSEIGKRMGWCSLAGCPEKSETEVRASINEEGTVVLVMEYGYQPVDIREFWSSLSSDPDDPDNTWSPDYLNGR